MERKTYIIVLQIIMLLMIQANHYLVTVFYHNPLGIWFGIIVYSVITDVILLATIAIELIIIVLLIEEVKK